MQPIPLSLTLECIIYVILSFLHNLGRDPLDPFIFKYFPVGISVRNLHHIFIHIKQPQTNQNHSKKFCFQIAAKKINIMFDQWVKNCLAYLRRLVIENHMLSFVDQRNEGCTNQWSIQMKPFVLAKLFLLIYSQCFYKLTTPICSFKCYFRFFVQNSQWYVGILSIWTRKAKTLFLVTI